MSSFFKPNRTRNELVAQLKEQVLGCFGYTTAHGYGRIAAATDSRARKWFWFVICCAAFGSFTTQLLFITQQFMSQPLKTRISISHDKKLAFPQITICNLNIIRKSQIPIDILTKFPDILGGASAVSKRMNKTLEKKTLSGSRKKALPDIDDLPEKEQLIQSVLQKLAEKPEESLTRYGHQLKEMIMSCHYNNLECLADDMEQSWTRFWHRRYGNCFTFNSGTDSNGLETEVVKSSQPGVGLTLEINIQQDEYISELSQEAGVRVFIGGQHEMPFPYEQGISASPGYSTAIQLRKVVIGRLDPFKNRSCEARTDQFKQSLFARYNVTYTTMACKMSCLAAMMNETCGCVWYRLKYNDQSVCDSENKSVVSCINDVFGEFDNGSCEKRCVERCREDTFKASVSLAKWPSKQFMESLTAEIEYARGNRSLSGDLELSEHFLKLEIYYGELNFEVIEEEYAYTAASFWSDVGGLMGMWIGISVLTLVELLELIASLLFTVFKTRTKKTSHVVDVKPPKDASNTQGF